MNMNSVLGFVKITQAAYIHYLYKIVSNSTNSCGTAYKQQLHRAGEKKIII